MNENQKQKFLARLDAMIDACAAEIQRLELDDRRDEAVFVKIRMNVYDIFRTVFKTAAGQPETFFSEKLEQIPASWRASLALAREHGNEEKAHIEQIKLDAAAEVRNLFQKLEVTA